MNGGPPRRRGGLALEEEVRHARLESEERAARRLRRVGGEHGPDVEPSHRRGDVERRTPGGTELAHRPARRRLLRLVTLHVLIRAPPAYALHLLGGIDEEEEEREGARRRRREIDRQRRRPLQQLVEARGVGVTSAPVAARLAQLFDGAKGVLAVEAADDAA